MFPFQTNLDGINENAESNWRIGCLFSQRFCLVGRIVGRFSLQSKGCRQGVMFALHSMIMSGPAFFVPDAGVSASSQETTQSDKRCEAAPRWA